MIAVCLLTCGPDRLEETERTVRTFAHLNRDRDDLSLLHVDGGGPGRDENIAIAKAGGFGTAWAPRNRVGQIESFRFFLDGAGDYELMLWLENDWESERGLPPIEFFQAHPDVAQFRLFGTHKMRGDGPRARAGAHIIETKNRIHWWQSKDPEWEIARRAHWGAGGTLVRPGELLPYHGSRRMKDVIVSANDLTTMRPRENYLWHIGAKTTEGFFG